MPDVFLIEVGFAALSGNYFETRFYNLREKAEEALRREKIEFSRLRVFYSEYRLAFLAEGILRRNFDKLQEVKGPKISEAFDANNAPTPAAVGFAAAQGVLIDDLAVRQSGDEKFLFAYKTLQSAPLNKVAERLKNVLFSALPLVSPTWKAKSIFSQPPLYLLCLLNESVCEIELEGLKAGRLTAVGSENGITMHEVESAQAYPAVMARLGVINSPEERKKTFNTKIRLLLPEGAVLSAEGGRVEEICSFGEFIEPMVLKLCIDGLALPKPVIKLVLHDKFFYLACEKLNELIPCAVALSNCHAGSEAEIKLKTYELNNYLLSFNKTWLQSLNALTAELEALFANKAQEKVKNDGLLLKCVSYLANSLGLKSLTNELKPCVRAYCAAMGAKAAAVLPSAAPYLAYEAAKKATSELSVLNVFKELCDYKSGYVPLPALASSRLFALAVMLFDFAKQQNGSEKAAEEIYSFLSIAKLKLNIFGVFEEALEKPINRRAWLEYALNSLSKEQRAKLISASFINASEFDYTSFKALIRSLKEANEGQIAEYISVYNSLCAKVEGIAPLGEELFASLPAEEAIIKHIRQINLSCGVDYEKILELLTTHRAGLEACLMDLPPVIDDANPAMRPRINLIHAVIEQLERLPFICKEKQSVKK